MGFFQNRRGKWFIAGIAVALAVALPLVIHAPHVIDLFFLVLLYAILGQSWNLLAGYGGLISLGHSALFGLGALTCRFLWESGLAYPLALASGGLAAVMAASIIGLPAIRLKGFYFAIGTLALAEALLVAAGNLLPGISSLSGEVIANYSVNKCYYLALTLALVQFGAMVLLVHSKTGLGMMGIRDDEDTAAASGVSPFKHKLAALAISALFAGLAGGVFTFHHLTYYYNYPFSPIWSIDAMIIVVVGGIGTIFGPLIGSIIYIVLQYLFSIFLGKMHVLIFAVVFIAMVLLCPQGLVGALSRIWHHFHIPSGRYLRSRKAVRFGDSAANSELKEER